MSQATFVPPGWVLSPDGVPVPSEETARILSQAGLVAGSQDVITARTVLSGMGAIAATAPDGDVATAHVAMLQSARAAEYKAALAAAGFTGSLSSGPNWLSVLGLVGGALALYFIWKHYQSPKQVSSHEYPEPQDVRPRIRGLGRALGAFGRGKSFGRKYGNTPSSKYEFEPEGRLEGLRRRSRK